MDFGESEMEQAVRTGLREITDAYDRDYWRSVRNEGRQPDEFRADLADQGWLGIMVPEEYGGQGLGLQEAAIMAEELGRSGGGRTATNLGLTACMYGGGLLPQHGSAEQQAEWLPRLASGEAEWAIGVTEPNAGLNTTNIETTATQEGDEYVIDGHKQWTTGIDTADRVALLARTLSPEDADSRGHGLTIFLVDPDDPGIEYEEIPIDTYHHHPSFTVHIDGVRVPERAIVGEKHRGLYHFFSGLNIERTYIAASVYGIGSHVLERTCEYANDREVFDAPIGSHQAIQHPLADAYADLECAGLMVRRAAWLYDSDSEAAGGPANIANLKAAEAAWAACEAAMTTFGGMSISSELGMTKYWEEVRHMRTAPVSEELIRNYIAEHELGLPRSY
ncbi:MAG: acyl-CoA dehydrogenase family protein [Salinirussus sp.]